MRALREGIRSPPRLLRKLPTRSECLLWEGLRGRRLDGRKFRRQHPVGRFVLDFYCPAEKLAIEVDGSTHDSSVKADEERQEILESLGIAFIRLPAELVETDLPAALAIITTTLARQAGEGLRAAEG